MRRASSLSLSFLALAVAALATLHGEEASVLLDRIGGAIRAGGEWTGSSLVSTRYGKIRGFYDTDDCLVWRGIPYAAAPVGELRWKAPQDPPAWEGVREAILFGESALQPIAVVGGVMGSEDCLYLNVWRPASEERDLPVYVFIHGGSNLTGSANLFNDYYGQAVASRSKMVFVSVNYRLGPMGWFLDDKLAVGSDPLSASGNFGSLDLIKALQWVRDNIKAFGGDPGRVLIAGESAGAWNVLSLIISKEAAGLFHCAVVESGSMNATSVEKAKAASSALIADLLVSRGLAPDAESAKELAAEMPASELAAFLRAQSAREIVGLVKTSSMRVRAWPSVILDGRVMPAEGFEVLAKGNYANKVPVIIGSNKDELKYFLNYTKFFDSETAFYEAAGRYGSDMWRAVGVDAIADALTSAPCRPPVYVYRFDWGSPGPDGSSVLPGDWGRRVGSFHGMEVSFFLGNDTCLGPLFTGLLFTKGNRPGREALSADIMAYLASFAATGDPNGTGLGLPPWPAWRAAESRFLVLDADNENSRIHPGQGKLTREMVYALIESELAPQVAREVRAWLLIK